MTKQKQIEYPIRINKYLSYSGYCSRRQADRFIEAGQVRVNGKVPELGQKVQEGDVVEVGDDVIERAQNFSYVAFYKPRGVVSHTPNEGEKGVRDIYDPEDADLSPVGRLDKDSEGLLLLTNDGRIVDPLLNPKYEHEKEYEVWVNKPINPSVIKKLSKGVNIEGYTTKPAQARMTGEESFRIILIEGKHHQIRRMVTALGFEVERLKRIRIMNIKLHGISSGQARELTEKEKADLLSTLNMNN